MKQIHYLFNFSKAGVTEFKMPSKQTAIKTKYCKAVLPECFSCSCPMLY